MAVKKNTYLRFALRLSLGAAFGTLALVYVMPTPIGLGIAIAAAIATLFLEYKNALLMLISLCLVTLVLEGALRVLSREATISPYYRPHEMAALEKHYKPKQSLEMQVPHGDLLAIDPSLNKSLAVPRVEVFRTDSLGFRNDRDYSGEGLLLVGDSFVAGNGSSQEDTITARLTADHDIRGYNLGFQAGPLGYAERIAWAREKFPAAGCVVLMMFEGNDFQPIASAEAALRKEIPNALQDAIKAYVRTVRGQFRLSAVIFGLVTRAQAVYSTPDRGENPLETDVENFESEHTFVGTVGGQPLVFLRGYAKVVQRQQYDDFGFIRNKLLQARPDMLFFIPDKFRVYASMLDANRVESLPDAQWSHLSREASVVGIPAFNLTASLQARSKELLSRGQYTFWHDDTHWNGNGAAVAARAIADELRRSPNQRCSKAAPT